MRVLWTVLLVAGCGFRPQSATSGDDVVDAPSSVADAAKIFHDAKDYEDAPPACPDDDGDGICNSVDTYPCGLLPTAPASSIELTDNGGRTDFKLTNITIAGQGTLPIVNGGAAVRMQLHYVANDTACHPGNCVDQLEVGWFPTGARLGCVLDEGIPDGGDHPGDIDDSTFDAPTTHGSYELRIHIGQKFDCNMGGNTWYGGNTPPTDGVIAKLCVR